MSFSSVVYAADFSAPTIAQEKSAEVVETLEPENPEELMEETPEEIPEIQEPTNEETESVDVQIETENPAPVSADSAETSEDGTILFEDGTSANENSAAIADDNTNSEEGQDVYQGFVYEENEDGTLSISGYCGEEKEHLVVPETINGKEVTRVKDGFADSIQDSLISIKMPSIRQIDSFTFWGYEKLSSVEAPKVTRLMLGTFEYCYALTEIDLGQCTLIDETCFDYCKSLEEINLPNVIRIDDSAFFGCSSLKTVYLPKIESIGENAFQDCSSLETIDLSSVIQIGKMAFVNCPSLKSVTFSEVTESMGTVSFGYGIKEGYRPENYLQYIYPSIQGLTFYCPSGSMASIYGHAVGIPVVWTDATPTPVPTTPTATPTPTVTPAQKFPLDTPRLNQSVSVNTKNIVLKWNKVNNADGYRVYIKSNGKWQALGNTATTSYTYSKVKAGQTYTFTVRAYKKTASGYIWSGYDQAGITATVLSTPKLNKSVSVDAKNITLNWAKASNADGYRVYVKTKGKWQALGNTTAASYTYSKAKAGQTYTFTVRAYKKTASGYVWSGYDRTGVSGSVLGTPKISKAVSAGAQKITLSWNKVRNANGYRVYVKANGKWQALGNTTASSYTYAKARSGQAYTFTVRAYKKTNSGYAWSSYDTAGITGVALDTPKLNKIRRSGTNAAISWKKVSGSTGYVVYRKAGAGQWKRAGIVTNGTSFTDRNLKKGTKYTYTVRAYFRVNGKSSYSSYNKKGLSVTIK